MASSNQTIDVGKLKSAEVIITSELPEELNPKIYTSKKAAKRSVNKSQIKVLIIAVAIIAGLALIIAGVALIV
jgi:hypothetical protein